MALHEEPPAVIGPARPFPPGACPFSTPPESFMARLRRIPGCEWLWPFWFPEDGIWRVFERTRRTEKVTAADGTTYLVPFYLWQHTLAVESHREEPWPLDNRTVLRLARQVVRNTPDLGKWFDEFLAARDAAEEAELEALDASDLDWMREAADRVMHKHGMRKIHAVPRLAVV